MQESKGTDRLGGWKLVCVCTHHVTLLNPPKCMSLFYIVKLIIFPLRLAIIIIFYFVPDYWLWKLINIFYYSDYVTITQHNCIMIGQQKKNRNLYHQNCHLTEKPVITLKSRWIWKLPWNFLKNTNDQVLLFFFPSRAPDMFLMNSHVLKQLDYMMIFYFYLVCLTFSISYSVLPFHLAYIFQFLPLFFFYIISQAFIKCNIKPLYTYI